MVNLPLQCCRRVAVSYPVAYPQVLFPIVPLGMPLDWLPPAVDTYSTGTHLGYVSFSSFYCTLPSFFRIPHPPPSFVVSNQYKKYIPLRFLLSRSIVHLFRQGWGLTLLCVVLNGPGPGDTRTDWPHPGLEFAQQAIVFRASFLRVLVPLDSAERASVRLETVKVGVHLDVVSLLVALLCRPAPLALGHHLLVALGAVLHLPVRANPLVWDFARCPVSV